MSIVGHVLATIEQKLWHSLAENVIVIFVFTYFASGLELCNFLFGSARDVELVLLHSMGFSLN